MLPGLVPIGIEYVRPPVGLIPSEQGIEPTLYSIDDCISGDSNVGVNELLAPASSVTLYEEGKGITSELGADEGSKHQTSGSTGGGGVPPCPSDDTQAKKQDVIKTILLNILLVI